MACDYTHLPLNRFPPLQEWAYSGVNVHSPERMLTPCGLCGRVHPRRLFEIIHRGGSDKLWVDLECLEQYKVAGWQQAHLEMARLDEPVVLSLRSVNVQMSALEHESFRLAALDAGFSKIGTHEGDVEGWLRHLGIQAMCDQMEANSRDVVSRYGLRP